MPDPVASRPHGSNPYQAVVVGASPTLVGEFFAAAAVGNAIGTWQPPNRSAWD